jgi:hypothetical protein
MADGTVKIDLLFPANKQKFHSDTELVNDLLKKAWRWCRSTYGR